MQMIFDLIFFWDINLTILDKYEAVVRDSTMDEVTKDGGLGVRAAGWLLLLLLPRILGHDTGCGSR